MKRRTLLLSAVAAGAAPLMRIAHAADYSNQPITLIVPFPAGGNTDVVARAVAPTLSELLGQSIIITNRGGADGEIGATIVSHSAPNGLTLLITAENTLTVLPLIVKTAYSVDSFAPIGLVAGVSLVLEANAKETRFKDVAGMLAYARANPGRLTVGHSGVGSNPWLAIKLLEQAADIKLQAIAYQGSGPALTDLLGGHIDMMVDQLTTSNPQIKAGNLLPLAVTALQRDPSLPNVPTLQEAGLKGFNVESTQGLMAPAGTPQPIIEKLHDALEKALQKDSVRVPLKNIGSLVRLSSLADYKATLEQQAAKARDLKKAGLLSDN